MQNSLAYQTTATREDTALLSAYKLTSREIEVLQLLVEGKSNGQIAASLFLSVETVKTHVRHVLQKLMVPDRNQAAQKAIERGMKRRCTAANPSRAQE